MEQDELRDILKMDFPDHYLDNEKIISLSKIKEPRINPNLIIKLAISTICIVLILIVTLFVNNDNNVIEQDNNIENISPTINKIEGFETQFSNWNSQNSKASLGYDIGYKAQSSVFDINDVKLELMLGHFFGPATNYVNMELEDPDYSFDYDTWKEGPNYSLERENKYQTAHIYIRTEIYPNTVEEEVGQIEDFYYKYLFIYRMVRYIDGKNIWFSYENITPRNTIKDFKIDSKFFKNDSGMISIGIGFGELSGSKYVNLYYIKDNNLIYLSSISIDDAINKCIENSNIETGYAGYTGFQ